MPCFEWTRTVRPLAGILVACGVAACSVLTSFDGLTSGNGGAESPAADGASPSDGPGSVSGDTGSTPSGSDGSGGGGDAGTSSADSASTDSAATTIDSAATDSASSSPDASGAPDAGTDTSPPFEAAAPPYCASLSPAPLFCDDFDEGALAAPWDAITGGTSGGGTVALSTAFSVSSPNALLTSVNANAQASKVDVAAYKSFAAKQGVAGVYTMAFDVRVDAADKSSSSDAVLCAIQLNNGTAYWDLELEVGYLSATGDFDVWMTENDATTNTAHHASAHLRMSTWTRVSLAITLPPGAGGATPATLSFNGGQIASATVHVSTSNPTTPEVVLGVTFATPATSGWAVRYDNVTFN